MVDLEDFPFESSWTCSKLRGCQFFNETWENSDLKQTCFSGFAQYFCETERVGRAMSWETLELWLIIDMICNRHLPFPIGRTSKKGGLFPLPMPT